MDITELCKWKGSKQDSVNFLLLREIFAWVLLKRSSKQALGIKMVEPFSTSLDCVLNFIPFQALSQSNFKLTTDKHWPGNVVVAASDLQSVDLSPIPFSSLPRL